MAASLRTIGWDYPRIEAMFSGCNNLKFANRLLLLVVIAATGFAPVAHATGPCLEKDGVKSLLDCAASAPCCCGTSPNTRACCCRGNDTPSPQLPAIPNDTSRTVKWMPWIDAALCHLTLAPSERSNSLPARSFFFFTPFQRSIQSLLCVWRI